MNRYYPHTIIAQEGWSFILTGLAISVFFSFLCGWWSLPFWVLTLFFVNFFRDPARNIPEAPDAVISPADGRIVVVERAIDPYRNTEALKISVFMNVFNVHSQRSPVSGVVTDVRYTAGKFLNAALDKSSSENESNAVLMTTRTGREITFVQVAGLIARRVLCYTNKGDNMVRGERYGFIRFGSRVDVYLPLDATANVAIGDKVRASETILAYLPLEKTDIANPDLATPVSSQSMAETRLKADIQSAPVAEAHFQAAAKSAEYELSLLDQARLAVQAEQLKTEAAKQAAEQARAQAEAEIAKLKAEAEQARAQAEQAKAQAEAEVARLKAEQEAKAQADAEAAAKLKAEQEAQAAAEAKARADAEAAAKLKAEQEAQAAAEAKTRADAEAAAKLKAEQEAQAAKARAEAVAKAQAEQKAKEEAIAQAKAQAEAKLKADQEAKLKAEQAAKAKAKAEQEGKARAEAEALAEIAARKPIVRREVFAAVPEPWQTIEPREVIIRTEIVDKK